MHFHLRFNTPLLTSDVQDRLVNRLQNTVFGEFLSRLGPASLPPLNRTVATLLGVRSGGFSASGFAGKDLLRTLRAVEAIYEASGQHHRNDLTTRVRRSLRLSEIDLGLDWKEGRFLPTGAALLDDALVNDPLRWMKGESLKSIREPFEKGLRHYLEATKRPELLTDVITDMYEALEATAKTITGRDADLSGNRELFLSKVDASDAYKNLLKEYISYANRFRHADERPAVKPHEVESFIYQTGLVIRLAIPHS